MVKPSKKGEIVSTIINFFFLFSQPPSPLYISKLGVVFETSCLSKPGVVFETSCLSKLGVVFKRAILMITSLEAGRRGDKKLINWQEKTSR